MKGAALDVDFDLDVAEATEGEAEEVVVGILDVVAVEAGKFTVTDFDDGVGGEGFLGELDVLLADDAGDSLTECAAWLALAGRVRYRGYCGRAHRLLPPPYR